MPFCYLVGVPVLYLIVNTIDTLGESAIVSLGRKSILHLVGNAMVTFWLEILVLHVIKYAIAKTGWKYEC